MEQEVGVLNLIMGAERSGGLHPLLPSPPLPSSFLLCRSIDPKVSTSVTLPLLTIKVLFVRCALREFRSRRFLNAAI